MKALVEIGDEAVPALLEALEHGEREIRGGAVLCLGAMRARQATAAICTLATSDPDRRVRPLALRAVCDLSGPDAPALIKRTLLTFLTHEDMFARALACQGIGRLRDPAFRVALKKTQQDPEEWVREAADRAMLELLGPDSGHPEGGPAALVVARTDPAPAQQQTRAMISAEDHQLALALHLAARLGSPDPGEQQEARQALIDRGEAVIPTLVPLLENELAPGRRLAVEVLGGIGAAAGMTHLARLLEVETLRPSVLLAMSQILQRSSGLEDFPFERVLTLLRREADQLVRAAAATALVCAGPRERQIALGLTVRDTEEWVLVSACRTLACLAGPEDREAVPLLLDHLARLTGPDGRGHVLAALQRILVDPLPEDQRVVGPLSYFLHTEDLEVRLAAGLLIARIARQVDGPTLVGLLDLLPVAEAHQRRALVQALGRLGRPDDPATIEGLSGVLYGRDPDLAREAARALIQIGGAGSVDTLIAAANSRQGQVVAIAAQELAAMDARGSIIGARLPDGRWERRMQHWCECGGKLRWVARGDREELRCETCQRPHVVSQAGKLFAEDRTPLGTCRCPECRRRQPLIRQGTSDTLICPATGKVHIRPFDHLSHVRLITDLPLGACACCAEPQPLIKVDEQVSLLPQSSPLPRRGEGIRAARRARRRDARGRHRRHQPGAAGRLDRHRPARRRGAGWWRR